jgi:hypothetical protein
MSFSGLLTCCGHIHPLFLPCPYHDSSCPSSGHSGARKRCLRFFLLTLTFSRSPNDDRVNYT